MKVPRSITLPLLGNGLLIAFAICHGLLKTGNPSRYFGEGRYTTAFSCAQLLAAAYFSGKTFFVRRTVALQRGAFSSAWVWALIATGFVFLTADDALQIHEHLDGILHKYFPIPRTPLTDHIDDALIALYGLIGLFVLWIFRREVLTFRQILVPLVTGFVCLLVSVVFDTVSNGDQMLLAMTGNLATAKWLDGWCSTGDGAFTLLGEGFFVAAFYVLYQAAKARPVSQTPGVVFDTVAVR